MVSLMHGILHLLTQTGMKENKRKRLAKMQNKSWLSLLQLFFAMVSCLSDQPLLCPTSVPPWGRLWLADQGLTRVLVWGS